MLSKMSGPLQGGLVGLRRSDELARVLSDDGHALLVVDRARLRWVPRRDIDQVPDLSTLTGGPLQEEISNHGAYPGLDGGPIEVGDWVSGHTPLPSMGPSGVAEVVGFRSVAGSLHVDVVRGDGSPAHEHLVRVIRVMRRRSLIGPDGDVDQAAHPIDFFRCHVCGAVPASVSSLTGVAFEHGGPRAERCPMSGRRLIDPPAA